MIRDGVAREAARCGLERRWPPWGGRIAAPLPRVPPWMALVVVFPVS